MHSVVFIQSRQKKSAAFIDSTHVLPNFALTPQMSLGDSKYTIFNVYTHFRNKKK